MQDRKTKYKIEKIENPKNYKRWFKVIQAYRANLFNGKLKYKRICRYAPIFG